MIPYRTESAHLFVLMNSATKFRRSSRQSACGQQNFTPQTQVGGFAAEGLDENM